MEYITMQEVWDQIEAIPGYARKKSSLLKVREFLGLLGEPDREFQVIHVGDDPEREITTPFCCDLLSVAMGKAPAGCAWVTVMGNMNTLAVATLVDAACIILAEGAALDETARKKAEQQDIMVLATEKPVFEAALWVWQQMQGDAHGA